MAVRKSDDKHRKTITAAPCPFATTHYYVTMYSMVIVGWKYHCNWRVSCRLAVILIRELRRMQQASTEQTLYYNTYSSSGKRSRRKVTWLTLQSRVNITSVLSSQKKTEWHEEDNQDCIILRDNRKSWQQSTKTRHTLKKITKNTASKYNTYCNSLNLIIIKSYTKYRIQHENKQTKKPTSLCKHAK